MLKRPEIDPLHRGLIQLAVLAAIATAAFFVTRGVARSNRAALSRDASEWFIRGQGAVARGDAEGAIHAFRRALLNDRSNPRYTFALAGALMRGGDTAGSRNALLGLRQTSPEDPQVNVQLARLAVAQKNVPEAVRYFQNALYAPWPDGSESGRRRVRLEMIAFLLDQEKNARAVSEILALGQDMPDSASHYIELGRLFADAGDYRRALDAFDHVLAKTPRDTAALGGAAHAAFSLRDFGRTAGYLRAAPAMSDSLQHLREVTNWVLSVDPLAPRISSALRVSRLRDDLAWSNARLAKCTAAVADGRVDAAALTTGIATLDRYRRRGTAAPDSLLEEGVAQMYNAQRAIVELCPPATARDEAQLLIGRLHGATIDD